MIKKFFSTKKPLVENFISLSVLQGANYILPLITVPYLVRILGPEKYGLISFAQAFVQYFMILTDYGFNLTATRKISIERDDSKKISNTFSTVIFIKIFFSIISLIILCIIISYVPKFNSDRNIYLITFGSVIGMVFFPVWFFQGMEKMKYITFLNLLARLISTISIFIFVKVQNDYINVVIINSIATLFIGFLSIYLIIKNFNIKINFPSSTLISRELRDGWDVFVSNLAISSYTYTNTFILGLFTNNNLVGYYSAAEKLIRAIAGLFSPLSQTIYPYLSRLAAESKQKAIIFVQKVLVFTSAITLIMSLLTFVFAEKMVHIVLGNKFIEASLILKVLSFLPFIITLSSILGTQIMLVFQMNKAYSRVYIFAGILNLFMALILVPIFKHVGTAISVVATELFVSTAMLVYLLRKDFPLFKSINITNSSSR